MSTEFGRWGLWIPVFVFAVWLTDWGAGRIVVPFQKLRRTFGLSGVAGAAVLAMVTASPELATNSVAALRGVSEIGLGNVLGANIVSVPLLLITGYLAVRTDPRRERTTPRLRLERDSVNQLAWPYVGIIGMASALTLWPFERGLQPIDGWLMIPAYVAFLIVALRAGKRPGNREPWSARELTGAALGALAVLTGAYLSVRATEGLVAAWGISQVVAGIFITGTVSVLPEALKAWHLARAGDATSGTVSVLADNAVTLSLGLVPLAWTGLPIERLTLYCVNLAFVLSFALAFIVFMSCSRKSSGLSGAQVSAVGVLYGGYLAMSFGWLL